MRPFVRVGVAFLVSLLFQPASSPLVIAAQKPAVVEAVFEPSEEGAPEIATRELQAILEEGRVAVLDVRQPQEYAIAHIPGSRNLWEKEVEQVVAEYPDKATPLVFYCNGPYCGKSRRLSQQLIERGYTGIRRYQLGMPVWRALGNTVQTDLEGARYIREGDRTAVFVDARSPERFAEGTLPGAVHVRAGEAEVANEDGRLPYGDKGTRLVVFGDTPEEARRVAEEIARKAYWNSSFFGGTYDELRQGLDSPGRAPAR